MRTSYEVFLNEVSVGTMEVTRSGLYYKLHCICDFPTEEIYRIIVQNGDVTCDLGPCIPLENGFGITTQVPVKRIGEGVLSFFVKSKLETANKKFVPVDPNLPFDFLCALDTARFARKNGIPGVIIRCDQPESDGL